MLGPKQLDELGRRVFESLPAGFTTLSDDLRDNFKAAVTAGLGRMELVTREEFDIQRAVLQRTREKLEALEERVRALENTSD
ncbi:MAG: accessory factor UbiK family protein [Chromatiales bacterium]|jgi:ubiquinone biosynthesis accessory factor UbiK|nr:accessory factor UbiK family protein [Chromatiales bacterium]